MGFGDYLKCSVNIAALSEITLTLTHITALSKCKFEKFSWAILENVCLSLYCCVAVLSNCTNPTRTVRELTGLFSTRIQWPRASAGASELQQFFHTAGVLLYVHGGSVCGAGQHVQDFILSFQFRLCLQGKVLQLHQHLHRDTHNQISLWWAIHFVCLCNYTSASQWTRTTTEQNANERGLNIKAFTNLVCGCRVEHVDHM